MEDFDSYPNGGRQLFKRVPRGKTTRLKSAPWFIRHTGQTACAYCNNDLVGLFEDWLQISLDHVVPKHVCKRFELKKDWTEDLTNHVLACGACNGLDNQYEPQNAQCPQSLEDFYNLRDRIFPERNKLIRERRDSQRVFFEIARAIDWRADWAPIRKNKNVMRVRINDKLYILTYNSATGGIDVSEGKVTGRIIRSFPNGTPAYEVKEFFGLASSTDTSAAP